MRLKQFALTLFLMLTLLYSTSWHMLNLFFECSLCINPATAWQQSSINGDIYYYLAQAEGQPSEPPYAYRIATPFVARMIMAVLHWPAIPAYLLIDALSFVAVGVGFTAYLMKFYRFKYPLALLGGVLAVTTMQMQGGLLLPTLEPLSYVAALAVFWQLHARNALGFVIAAAFAVAVKEVFIITCPLWIGIKLFDEYDKKVRADSVSRVSPGVGVHADTLIAGR